MDPPSVAQFIDALGPAFVAGDPKAAAKETENQNVAVVTNAYRAIARGDYQAFRDLLADDVELEIAGPAELPIAGKWSGRDVVMDGASRNYAKLEDQRPELLHVVAQGEMVAIIAREQGRIRATGRAYDIAWMHLFTARDGRIARIYGFCDSHGMVEAAKPAL